jgi:hypothetical protein
MVPKASSRTLRTTIKMKQQKRRKASLVERADLGESKLEARSAKQLCFLLQPRSRGNQHLSYFSTALQQNGSRPRYRRRRGAD